MLAKFYSSLNRVTSWYRAGFVFAVILAVAGGPANAVVYYVNNASTNGNVYTTAVGNDANPGTSPAAPKRTLTNLLETVTLLPGDVVYVDTGGYSNHTVTISASGSPGNPITFIGSTNASAGGTTFVRNNTGQDGIVVAGSNIVINGFRATAGRRGFVMNSSDGTVIGSYSYSNAQSGFAFGNFSSNVLKNSVAAWNPVGVAASVFNSRPVTVEHCTIWENTVGIQVSAISAQGLLSVSNSIISITGAASRAYSIGGGSRIVGNFNAICRRDGAVLLGEEFARQFYYLSDWQAAYTQELNSICGQARIASPSTLNFHLRSVTGRYDPSTGTFVQDADHSDMIDLGNPAWPFGNEPTPNGGRANLGKFGNTGLASMSRTNPWLRVVSFNDGGSIAASGTLYWVAGAFPTGSTVRLLYSHDDGQSWTTLASSVSATNSTYPWLVTNLTSTLIGRWRVESEADPGIHSTNLIAFTLRNSTNAGLAVFVNDNQTVGDIFTTSVGSFSNTGLSNSAPARTIQQVLDAYNLGPNDTIYVDTGVYTGAFGVVSITQADEGRAGQPMNIVGSTNFVAGGAILETQNTLVDSVVVNANFLRMENIRIRNSRAAVRINTGEFNEFSGMILSGNASGFRGAVSVRNSRMINNVVAHNNIGVEDFAGASNRWDKGVVWSNNTGFLLVNTSGLSLSNSVIVGGTSFGGAGVPSVASHVVFWNTQIGAGFGNLNELQKVQSRMWESTFVDPKLANPAGLNFHPLSVSGRFDPISNTFVQDMETSPLIDLGSPADLSFTNEPAPNGGRINIGAHGGTGLASKSPTNAWLQALTYNDGGQLSVPGDSIYWASGNLPSGATVRIEFSADGGGLWQVVETNLLASTGTYVWNNTDFDSTRFARWRVVLETNTAVVGENAALFTLRNGPFKYYVNDLSQVGDVYTTAPGNDSNLGVTPSSPKFTLTSVLTQYDLDPGDVVYVDTGVYSNNSSYTINPIHNGSTNEPVYILGSTNELAGGSVITIVSAAGGGSAGFVLSPGAQDILIANFTVRNKATAVSFTSASRIRVENVVAFSNTVAGFLFSGGGGNELRHVAAYQNSGHGVSILSGTNNIIQQSVIWMNRSNAVQITASGTHTISNSVLGASGNTSAIFGLASITNVIGDYNNYYTINDAVIADVSTTNRWIDTMSAWQAFNGHDRNSLNTDPLFANPELGDFHLRTETIEGRFLLGVGRVNDGVTSPLIDAGSPSESFSKEHIPNGGRIEIGRYGNTFQSSVGKTDPWLYAASLRQFGWVRGTAVFHWVAGNLNTTDLVRVEFSPDGGETWSVLTTGVSAKAESLAWNTLTTNNVVAGRWRVTSVDNPTISDQTTNFFVIRNGSVAWYLNDGNTSNDVFTSGPGSATNWMATANRPLNSLSAVFSHYDVEPGDWIYVDTGVYSSQSPVVAGRSQGGAFTSFPVVIQGSTHCGFDSSVLSYSGGVGLTLSDISSVVISNIVIEGATVGVQLQRAGNIQLSFVSTVGATSNGIQLAASTNVVISRSVSANNAVYGVFATDSANVTLLQNILWSNTAGSVFAVNVNGMSVSNSMLTASGNGRSVFRLSGGANFKSDYNNFLVNAGADVALVDSKISRILTSWQASYTNDRYSLSHAPGFVNPSARNFHLMSEAGRYDPSTCGFVNDIITSPMIDAASPLSPFGLETSPNGSRMNLGRFGNHPLASRTPATPRLLVVSLFNGGVIRGTNDLYWIATGTATGHTVRVEFSGNGGQSWEVLATNVPASSGAFTGWDTTSTGSLPIAYWRLVSEVDTNIVASNSVSFTINNGAISYYVNDADTSGDVYTTAPGSDANDGLDPSSPVASIAEIFSRYPVTAGDRILIDTGRYAIPDTLLIDQNIVGVLTNPVLIVGSTNLAYGGTVIDGGKAGPTFLIQGTDSIHLSNLRFTNSIRGIRIANATNITLQAVTMAMPQQMTQGQDYYGVRAELSPRLNLNRFLIYGLTNRLPAAGVSLVSSPESTIQNSIIWSNGAGIVMSLSSLALSNTSISAYGPDVPAIQIGLNSTISGDYNHIHARNGAVAFVEIVAQTPNLSAPIRYPTVGNWVSRKGTGIFTLSHDPLFHAPSAGDFFLKSAGGRLTFTNGIVQDFVTSPLIDAGNPANSFSQEPVPNGGRINIGIHGNSSLASLTPTNAGLTVITFNDGGVASGTNVVLRWLTRGDATNHTVRIRYSPNSGVSWTNLVTSLSPTNRQWTWNTTLLPSSLTSRWRIELDANPAVFAQTEFDFAVRNTNFVFYVNDSSTTGDVYTSSIGASNNTGLAASSPLPSLETLLDRYEMAPGDIIYVDTGVYPLSGVLTWKQEDTGSPTNPVIVVGSTNIVAGGSVISGGSILLDAPRGITIRNLIIDRLGAAGGSSLFVRQGTNTVIQSVDVIGGGSGMQISQSLNTHIANSSVRNATTNGLWLDNSLLTTFTHGILWSNRVAVQGFAGAIVENSIMGAFGVSAFIYQGSGSLVSDFNSIHVYNGALVASESIIGQTFPNLYETVGKWSQTTGRDLNSLTVNPGFVDPMAANFWLKSQAGRYDRTTGEFVFDDETSRLIDAANPSSPFVNETAPNGNRANIGRHGNTILASRTPTNPVLTAVSFNDGGNAQGTNVVLRWLAQGIATSHVLRLDFSYDGGVSWSNIITDLSPGTSSYSWNTTNIESTVLALWRVTSQNNTNIAGTTENVFSIRNGPVSFYVNDTNIVGDVYTTAPGTPFNNGITPSTPKLSISEILAVYDVEPGDVIYVDTGVYTLNQGIEINSLDGGSFADQLPVTIIGSTNRMAGGTLLNASSVPVALTLRDADYIQLKHLRIQNGGTGIRLINSPNARLYFIEIFGGVAGVSGELSSNFTEFDHCLIRNVSGSALSFNGLSGIVWRHGVLWSNAVNSAGAISLSSSSATFSNSVFVQFGTNAVYAWLDNSNIQADYNFFQLWDRAIVSTRSYVSATVPLPMQSATLSRWVRDWGRDRNSIVGDPGFADPWNGNFHPVSTAGRYNPLTGTFVNDTNTSLLVDAGSPLAAFSNESGPNGGRVNIGMFGNTFMASRSPVTPKLVAVRLRDGGRAEGASVQLSWRAYGSATGHLVRIEYSGNAGVSWDILATGIPARVESYFWNTTPQASTWLGKWRVVSEDNPSISGETVNLFAVRNHPLALYVNDTSTSGDVFTSAPGGPLNNGVSPSTPRDTLISLLADYDFEPGDTIYVDTGSYIFENTILWGRFDAWDAMTNLNSLIQGGSSVTLQGSTNQLAGGTQFIHVGPNAALRLDQAYGVAIKDIRIRKSPSGSGTGIDILRSRYNLLERIRVRDGGVGIGLDNSTTVRIRNMVSSGNTQYGLLAAENSIVDCRHSILWSNGVQVRVSRSTVTLENSVVGSARSGQVGLQRVDTPGLVGTLISDYNAHFAVPGAFIGELRGNYVGGRIPFERLRSWSESTGLDNRSYSGNPQFINSGAGDFHTFSPFGYYDIVSGAMITNNAAPLSPLIDGGNPASTFVNEPPYNGLRVNIGLYGNTTEASKSYTNGTLRALTFSDGGSGFGDIWLRWTASGPVASHLVYIEFSENGGVTWVTLASNVSASAEAFLWDSEAFGRVAAGMWRVTSQTDDNLTDTNPKPLNNMDPPQFFQLRQAGSAPYYINDSSTAGDVYTTAPGNDANDGFLPSTPKASLQALLDSVDLEPGDIVYIDTGVYASNSTITVSILDSGVAANPVIFRGSTNFTAGGSVFNRVTGVGAPLRFLETQGIRVENLIFQNGQSGVLVDESRDITFYNIIARNNTFDGVRSRGSLGVYVENSLMFNNATNGLSAVIATGGAEINANNTVVWGSPSSVLVDQSCTASISNSVLQAFGGSGRIYLLGLGVTNVASDYNNYIRQSGAIVAERTTVFGGNEFYGRLLDWQRFLGQDKHTLSHESLFADANGGDFHPRSATGRFTMSGSLTNDPPNFHSPLIDTGSPAATFTNEPDPNGGRLNIGRYGNTPEASLSKTNPWVLVVSLNDGGIVRGTQTLYWVAGGMNSSDTVRLEFAANGVDYSILSSNVPAYQSEFTWDASGEPVTQLARWRVISEQYTNAVDDVDVPFTIKNSTLTVYVNDGSTSGDVYTTAPGSADNSGLSPSLPLNDPVVALAKYPFGPGDVIYIDTGSYNISHPSGMVLGLVEEELDAGMQGNPIRIIGSTNRVAGGTRLIGSGNNSVLNILDTQFVDVQHLNITNAFAGITLSGTRNVGLRNIFVTGVTNAFVLNNAYSTEVSRVAAFNNRGWAFSIAGEFSDVRLTSSIAHSNTLGAISIGPNSRLFVEHNIFNVANSNAFAYSAVNLSAISGDFNVIWPGQNPFIARNNTTQVRYSNLRAWQRDRNMDIYSLIDDPLFVNTLAGDFHLRSQAGRFQPSTQTFVTDGTTSWAIDAGNFNAEFTAESLPNGARRNIGLYGNTAEASRSVTNTSQAAIKVVSLLDGGIISGEHQLYWLSRGLSTNDLLRLEYSANSGALWLPIASNIPVTASTYVWNFADIDSSPLGLWRITSQANSNITDTTARNFTIRNGSIPYYVNDPDISGDVFTTEPGSSLNDGISPETPVDQISTILTRYDLDGGDVIYVDTGTYYLDQPISILSLHSGIATNRTWIRGSTNLQAGGSVLYRQRVYTNNVVTTNMMIVSTNIVVSTNEFFASDNFSTAIDVGANAQYLEISDFTIENADQGIRVANSQIALGGHLFRNLLIRDGGQAGVSIFSSSSNRLDRVVITRHAGAGISLDSASMTSIDRSVIWSNNANAINISASGLLISNSVLHAYGAITNVAYSIVGVGAMSSDFNTFYVHDGASYVAREGFLFSGLPQWMQATGQDRHSLSANPRFHDTENDDYHVASVAGRFDPQLNDFVTSDVGFSPLIDTGSFNAGFMLEPEPNGFRRNIGLFGDTIEASKSRTNAWMLAITAMGGGRINDIVQLFWTFGNIDATNRVILEYSPDQGTNWTTIAQNVPLIQDGYFWDSLTMNPPQSPISVWRVSLEANTNIFSQSARFGLNGPFTFYVNDGFTNNNVYTTAPGDDQNLGIFSNAPKATLRAILDDWDVDPEDIILIDTGHYLFDSNQLAVVRLDDQGAEGLPVIIRGSPTKGATLFDGSELLVAQNLIEVQGSFVEIENISFITGNIEVIGTNNILRNIAITNGSALLSGKFSLAENMDLASGKLVVQGDDAVASKVRAFNSFVEVLGSRTVLENSLIVWTSGPLVKVYGTNSVIRNNTIVGGIIAVQQEGNDSSSLIINNILIADRSHNANAQIISRLGGTMVSDYNLLLGRNGAWIGNATGLWEKLIYWQQKSGQDFNSISADPAFANEAGRDYHLKSTSGRYLNGIWVFDDVDSPAIDAGSPTSDFSNETVPNGNRINIGAYGGTIEASRSRVTPWLYAISMNDGGVLRGTNDLRWLSGGLSLTNTVTLEYSPDAGDTWITIGNGIPINPGAYTWDTTLYPSSLEALWRVILDADTNIYDTVDSLFNVRNDIRAFFVNNSSTNGNVFTTVAGSPGNDGLTPATPKSRLEDILSVYDTEPGDVIYVDTGVYTSSVINVIWSRGGDSNANLYIRGSTNYFAGGTVIKRTNRVFGSDAMVVNASYVTVQDLTVENAFRGILLNSNQFSIVERVNARSNVVGIVSQAGFSNIIRSTRVWNSVSSGVEIITSGPITVENITFVNNPFFGVNLNDVPNNTIQNNIFYFDMATSNAQQAIAGTSNAVIQSFIDYNVYFFTPASFSNAFIYPPFKDLLTWQRTRFKDFRSAVTNPLMNNVAAEDFHLRSQAGRYNPGTQTFVMDAETSWAIDTGNPYSSFDRETPENGGRVNIGGYGNTFYASRGVTSQVVFARTGNQFLPISEFENPYPLIWYMLNVPFDFNVSVQYSGDMGNEWITLQSGVPAYQEYIVWTNSPIYNSFKAKWRIVGEGPGYTNYWDINDGTIQTFFGTHRISSIQPVTNGQRIVWRGAWDEDYQIQYATNFITTNKLHNWLNLGGPTNLVIGGDTPFVDTTVGFDSNRVYRVLWLGTNGIPYQ